MADIVKAPWTDDQVASLNAFQRYPYWHNFTCGTETCRASLTATLSGWVCPAGCGYTQDWALAGMDDWSWVPEFYSVEHERFVLPDSAGGVDP